MALPGTLAILLGFEAELLLIAAGGFTVIHGEGYAYRARWKVLVTSGSLFVGGALSGAFVGTVVWGQIEAGSSHWWLLLTVAFATTIAGVGVFVANALRLPPPGPWFILLVAGASTMTHRLDLNPVEVAAWASVGVVSSIIVGMAPALVRPHGPEEEAVDTLEATVAAIPRDGRDAPLSVERIHQAQTALAHAWVTLGDAGVIHGGRIVPGGRRELAERTLAAQQALAGASTGARARASQLADTPTYLDVSRLRVPYTRPSISYRLYRSAHRYSHATMTAVKVFIACLAASVVGIAFGLDRPDWAIVSALLILQWGLHRLLGSVLGIGLFAGLHLLDLGPWGLLLALAACQFFAEIFVVRNYVLCVIATTPLALMMGNALQLPLGETVVSRTIEVLLSVIFAVGVLWVVLRDAEPAHHARLLTAAPDDVLPQRRDLQFELLSERRAVQSLAANLPEVAIERRATHLEVQAAGYALLDRCNDRPDQRLPIGDIQDVADRVSRD